MYLNFCNPFLAASLLLTASSLSTFSMIVDVHCDTLTCTNGWFSSKLLHTCERGGATTAQGLFLFPAALGELLCVAAVEVGRKPPVHARTFVQIALTAAPSN